MAGAPGATLNYNVTLRMKVIHYHVEELRTWCIVSAEYTGVYSAEDEEFLKSTAPML